MRYADARSFRTALEARLRKQASDTGIALDRLRKECAHQRFLARLARVSPPGSWALKGGFALLTRLGPAARATKDADTSFRLQVADTRELIERACEEDLPDFFLFEVGAPVTLQAEAEEGGLRFPVSARLDGRTFENLQFDVNVLVDDPRPAEPLTLRNLLAFAGIEDAVVPVVTIEQHLAEKLHAYTRSYAEGENSRVKDLFDMLVIAERLPVPSAQQMKGAVEQTFSIRTTLVPEALHPPPSSWEGSWKEFYRDHHLSWPTLDEAYEGLNRFWLPILNGRIDGVWNASKWAWHRV